MPFGMVRGVGRGMCVLDGVVIVVGEGAVLGVNVGRPNVTGGDFVAYLCESDALFPDYFGQDLFVKFYLADDVDLLLVSAAVYQPVTFTFRRADVAHE